MLTLPKTSKVGEVQRFLHRLSGEAARVSLDPEAAFGHVRGDLHMVQRDTGRDHVINLGQTQWMAPYLHDGGRTDRLDKGGRPIGHWAQTFPRDLRHLIRIDGAPIGLADISASHLAICYATRNAPFPVDRDIYADLQESARISRPLAKISVLGLMNAKDRRAAEGHIACHVACERLGISRDEILYDSDILPTDRATASLIADRAARVFAPIAADLFSDAGVRCQAKEADILRLAATRLMDDHGAAPILMHDAVMVRADLVDAAADALRLGFHRITRGGDCRVTSNYAAREIL